MITAASFTFGAAVKLGLGFAVGGAIVGVGYMILGLIIAAVAER